MKPFEKTKHFFFVKLTKVSPTRGFAFLVGLCSLFWALAVVNPLTESFASPIFSILLAIAPEQYWAVLPMFAGLTKLGGVLFRSSAVIRLSGFVGMMFWMALGIFIIAEAPWSSGAPVFIVLSLMNAWIYLQVKFHPEIISGNKILPDTYASIEQIEERENGDKE